MKIRDVMTRRVMTVSVDDDLELARQTMLWGGFRHVPVVERGNLAGVVSERDVFQAKASAAAQSGRRPLVRDVMRVPVETARADEDVDEVSARMAARKLGCVVVVENGAIEGLVTTTDLLAQMGEAVWVGRESRLPPVESLMSVDPPTARPDESLADAAVRMAFHRVRHLPVLDANEKVIGILSDRDVLRGAAPRGPSRALGPAKLVREPRVEDAMTKTPFTVSPDTPSAEAMALLAERRIGALPVVDGTGGLRGIVSYVDFLAWFGGSPRFAAQAVPTSEETSGARIEATMEATIEEGGRP